MEINNKNIKELFNISKDNRLCNDLLFSIFFKRLKLINFDKIDNTLSSIHIVDENYKSLNIKDWDSSSFPKVGYSYYIKLIPKNTKGIILEFNLWAYQINGYIGKESLHFIEDAVVKTQNDLIQLEENLSLLFESKIIEELHYKNSRFKKAIYRFYKNEKLVKTFKQRIGFPLIFSTSNTITKKELYPWI